MTGQSTNPQTVAAVERAFAVLRVMAEADESVGISAIARATGLAKSTVSRLVATLERLGMAQRVGRDGRFRLGPGLAAFTPGVTSSLVELARPHLRDLVDETGEDAGLAVSDGFDVLYVDQVQGEAAVQVQDWTGARFPPHGVAAGYVLMRAWPAARLASYLGRPLAALAPETETDPEAVRSRVASWERFIWTHREFAADVNGVAAPIRGADGSIVAAVNQYGPSYRFPGDRDETEIGGRLARAGERVSQHLAAVAAAP